MTCANLQLEGIFFLKKGSYKKVYIVVFCGKFL